jgi:GR25 family glycosyltransferase involved in LPS biosynthesis
MSSLDNLCLTFLKEKNEVNALNFLRCLRQSNEFNVGLLVSEYFTNQYPNSYYILQEYSICCYYAGKIETSFDITNQILQLRNLSQEDTKGIIFNQHFCLKEEVLDRYIGYNSDTVNFLLYKKPRSNPLITLTMTTCKRFDLFEKTVNSILNCFEDIDMIDYFFCVDDNSSEEDREKMKKLYPFFTFYFKNPEEKGHPKSMNIIRDYVINTTKTPYIIHLEDDWKFFTKKSYIKDAFEVLSDNDKIGQCLFNKNYIETEKDVTVVKGGEFHVTDKGMRYYIHEFVNTEEKKAQWLEKHGCGLSSNYWPHFSFRPSLLRTKILEELGEFDTNVLHFEMVYAHKYVEKGYVSAFFENLYCIHTGRLTSQIYDDSAINAYILNNEKQFFNKENKTVTEEKVVDDKKIVFKLETFVVNLDRRPDRWEKFLKNSEELKFLNVQRFSAVDGLQVKSTTQLQRIFNNNDYDMKRGMVGCLMSHIKKYIDLINSNSDVYCLLEDDIEITPNFENKLIHVFQQGYDTNWDLIYLGHHLRNLADKESEYDKDKMPKLKKVNVYQSFQLSLGGTIGYLITKSGAQKLLDFISEHGATNCIDTLQQKSANILNVYYCNPQLVYSECFRNENKNIDTDIQNNHTSLSLSLETKVEEELKFYKDNNLNITKLNYDEVKNKILKESKEEFFVYTNENVDQIKKLCNEKSLNHYTIEDKVIFVFYSDKNIERYCHAFKIDNKYSIADCSLNTI